MYSQFMMHGQKKHKVNNCCFTNEYGWSVWSPVDIMRPEFLTRSFHLLPYHFLCMSFVLQKDSLVAFTFHLIILVY